MKNNFKLIIRGILENIEGIYISVDNGKTKKVAKDKIAKKSKSKNRIEMITLKNLKTNNKEKEDRIGKNNINTKINNRKNNKDNKEGIILDKKGSLKEIILKIILLI